jgi:hypothetical protein
MRDPDIDDFVGGIMGLLIIVAVVYFLIRIAGGLQ